MKRRKITGMLMSVIMILSMMSSAGANVVVHNKSTQKTISSQSGEYIIMANNNASKQKIKEELNLKINKYSKLSDEQNVNVAEITEAQATKLKNDKNVKIIEKNIQLKGSGNIVNPEQVNANWNIELINAEREKRKIKKIK